MSTSKKEEKKGLERSGRRWGLSVERFYGILTAEPLQGPSDYHIWLRNYNSFSRRARDASCTDRPTDEDLSAFILYHFTSREVQLPLLHALIDRDPHSRLNQTETLTFLLSHLATTYKRRLERPTVLLNRYCARTLRRQELPGQYRSDKVTLLNAYLSSLELSEETYQTCFKALFQTHLHDGLRPKSLIGLVKPEVCTNTPAFEEAVENALMSIGEDPSYRGSAGTLSPTVRGPEKGILSRTECSYCHRKCHERDNSYTAEEYRFASNDDRTSLILRNPGLLAKLRLRRVYPEALDRSVLGLRPPDLVGRLVAVRLHSDDEVYALVSEVVEGEHKLVLADGSTSLARLLGSHRSHRHKWYLVEDDPVDDAVDRPGVL
eukprot:TRINITY_DN154_c1_g1_i1.p1 TRINITY_DN154_c1_g1~~TRINITY_DN154_c1_g1_i1.p1  ORF type:complete len:377 (-),score=39.27 TRINITY_DN154_c1_g1_i1:402-1532(-)